MKAPARTPCRLAVALVVGAIAVAWPAHLRAGDADATTDAGAGAAGQQGDSAVERFERASDLMAGEDFATATTLLLAIADQLPGDDLADDALFAAAGLCEEKLGEPARALAIYDRILADYPDSRVALAASRRAGLLRSELGPNGHGADPLATFTAIQHNFTAAGAAASVTAVEALLEEYPSWSGRPRALMWLADLHAKEGRTSAAIARYVEAATSATDPRVAFAGYRGAGGSALAADRFDEAERYFRLMPIEGDPSRQQDFEHALVSLDNARLRARFFQLAFVILLLIAVAFGLSLWRTTGSLRDGLAELAHPPAECLYMLPIAVVFIVAGYSHPDSIGPAVALICTVSFAFIWLNGATLDAILNINGHLGRARLAAHIFATITAVTAICYIAVHRTHLIDQILTTVRFGPDA